MPGGVREASAGFITGQDAIVVVVREEFATARKHIPLVGPVEAAIPPEPTCRLAGRRHVAKVKGG